MSEMIRVKAKQLGYYDLKRRKEDCVFDIDPKHFSEKWMEKLEDSPSAPSGRSSNPKSRFKPIESDSKQNELEVI